MSDRQKILLAIVASVLMHGLACLFLMVWTWLWPQSEAEAAIIRPMKTVEVTILPPPKPPPKPVALAIPKPERVIERSVLDTEGLTSVEKPPDNAVFESDKNSRAASDLPATGSAPMPSQQGKERPTQDFTTHDYSLGKGAEPAAPEPAMEVASLPKPTPKPEPTPVATPTPVSEPIFKPTPIPAASPTPPNGFAIQKPTPIPVESPKASPPPLERPKPSPTATPENLAMLNPTPAMRTNQAVRKPPSEPGYQPQKEQTRIDGAISDRGKAGVDALNTPRGRYQKIVQAAIGSRWYWYVDKGRDLISQKGGATVRFHVDQDGHIKDAKVISNTSDDTLAQISLQAVMEAKLPPLPDELAPFVRDGVFEIEFTFTLY